jgi:thioredoxin reductase (NADPH)
MADKLLDCLIIGGGPAGLTAAVYLARFHMNVKVIDDGNSRANWIPTSHNHAGYPEGIKGSVLLEKMTEQARLYGAKTEKNRVTRLEIDEEDGGFVAEWGSGPVHARAVLLATGVMNRRPSMDPGAHEEAMARGLLRYCPICDGYEVTDKNVGVIGTDEHGIMEAIFLRGYTPHLTLISPSGAHHLTDEQRRRAESLAIRLVDGPCYELKIESDQLAVPTADGLMLFDSVYPALGSDVHSDLAKMVGAHTAGDGCILVDDHQRCSVPSLYAAGDVVIGLDQISHAMGEGGVAAVTIRNDLTKDKPLIREDREVVLSNLASA